MFGKKLGRRDWLKGLATLPVLGALIYGSWKNRRYREFLQNTIHNELDLDPTPSLHIGGSTGDRICLGIIGFGGRGEHIIRSIGFAHPEVLDQWKKAALNNPMDKRYEEYQQTDDLNIEVNGVCDVFDVRAERGIAASANIYRNGTGGKMGEAAKRYRTYRELLEAPDIDAVIIATPDHWHARMSIDAAKANKHVYVEKGMTRTVEETYRMVDAVRENNIAFQLGHQGRQTESYMKAEEIVRKNILGNINLVEVTTNRNSPNGAWVYPIHPEGSPETIDWQQFTGSGPQRPFSLERFFRWRCWWDYGTGLSGDLLTHEYDSVNQIMKLGIPHSAVASGGIYFFKDGREVPDVFNVTYEYPERDLTLLYSATLASNRSRGKMFMGHDAHMELGNTITVWADWGSTRYREMMDKGLIDTSKPLYTFIPGKKDTDAIASATERYFAGRGLLYTYRGGKRVDTTYLHVQEWLEAIRQKKQPSCNIDQGFEEAITSHMGTLAFRENRKVYWDPDKKQII